jgi:hypothetical protein
MACYLAILRVTCNACTGLRTLGCTSVCTVNRNGAGHLGAGSWSSALYSGRRGTVAPPRTIRLRTCGPPNLRPLHAQEVELVYRRLDEPGIREVTKDGSILDVVSRPRPPNTINA